MEYEDVQERLNGMVSNVSLPSERKAAIWANIQKEVQAHEKLQASRRRRNVWYRTLSVGAAAACVAGIFTFVYEGDKRAPSPVQNNALAIQGPSVVMQFEGSSDSWVATLSQVSQHQQETDYMDLTYQGVGIAGGSVVCDVLDTNHQVIRTGMGTVQNNKVRIAFTKPIAGASDGFSEITSMHYLISVKWSGKTEQVDLTYKQSYTTK